MRNLTHTLISILVLLPGMIFAQQSPAQYPHQEINNWGKWGTDDQKGAVHYITPDVIIQAAKLIKKGKTFSLAIPIDMNGPIFPGRLAPHHTMAITGADYATGFNTEPILGKMKYADDYLYMALQGSTQWDALSHAWYGDELYNGYPEKAIMSGALGGATMPGIENVKESLIGRGVLVGEIWWLEDLAKDCAEDGVYEFFLASQPLNIPGAVGSPINPVAIK